VSHADQSPAEVGDAGGKEPVPDAGEASCSERGTPDLDACKALVPAVAHPAGGCDKGFRPRHARFVYCSADDLLCVIRRPAWDHAPIYRAATEQQAPACLRECEAGNGASCKRLAKALGEWGSDDAHRDCARRFAEEACRRGLPYACQEHPACSGEPTRAEAAAQLERACDPVVASWKCFYAAHSREMLWGTGPAAHPKLGFRELCSARCPPSPERCYRPMACAVAALP